ncbi:hypothetical protein IBT49_16165 [Erwinia sp. S63]|uniref:hypothetical protein n=1 Tax=Erwinia sp. S63 TaxID=2769341 RepID=UPI00190DD657|nr:hypothetical protein [Erwinia sp. S63]MBK0097521.1 hypothetical protein [Erwinia sp. S63]
MTQRAHKYLIVIATAVLTLFIIPWGWLGSIVKEMIYEHLSMSQVITLTTSFDGTVAPEPYDDLSFTIGTYVYLIFSGIIYSLIISAYNFLKKKETMDLFAFIKNATARVIRLIILIVALDVVFYFFPNKLVIVDNEINYINAAISMVGVFLFSCLIYKILFKTARKGA